MLDIAKLEKKIVDYHDAYMKNLEIAHANLGAMQACQEIVRELKQEELNLNSESEQNENSSDSRD